MVSAGLVGIVGLARRGLGRLQPREFTASSSQHFTDFGPNPATSAVMRNSLWESVDFVIGSLEDLERVWVCEIWPCQAVDRGLARTLTNEQQGL